MSKPIANVAAEQVGRPLLEQARQLLAQRQYQAAEEMLRQALVQEPTDAAVFDLLGLSAELRGHLQDASRFFRAALSFEPAYGPAQVNLKRVTGWPYSTSGLSEALQPSAD
jgi:Tfp pilus assembly protein PilF